jgi:ATP-dependent Clp protease ATP-binding subunit ClpC
MEKHTVSRLVGSPPGYVGFEEGGQLTEQVRRKPYSIILFDEIEKAHPDVFNVLLQILEEGHLTDAQGRKVDFKNTVIIMTSNVGARDIVKTKSVGFASAEEGAIMSHDTIRERVTGELKKMFRPEFLNRVDEVIVFHELTHEEILAIVDLMVGRLREQLAFQGIGVQLNDEARELLAKEGFDPSLGARPLRRAIQRLVEDPLSEQILAQQWKAGDVVELVVKEGTIAFERAEAVAEPAQPAQAAGTGDTPKKSMPPRAGRGSAGGSADGAMGA